jgi:cell division initiation protein
MLKFVPVHITNSHKHSSMKVTPIEIRQKSFEKVFRGYDREEVDAFLLSLSQEWERVIDENKESRIKLELADREVRKLREVENTLYKTLKTAEDTGSHLIEQANKSAELQMKEAQVKADSIIREARSRANQMVQDADMKARHTLEEALKELKSLERDCRAVENQRENLLADLRTIVNDVLEKLNRIDAKGNRISFESKIDQVRTFLEERPQPPSYNVPEREAVPNNPAPSRPSAENRVHGPENQANAQPGNSVKNSSFFDELGS